MSLEDSILLLAEAVQELAIAVAASTPPLALEEARDLETDDAQTSIQDFTLTEAWPSGSEHGGFGKPKHCTICGREGFNKRTHDRHYPW